MKLKLIASNKEITQIIKSKISIEEKIYALNAIGYSTILDGYITAGIGEVVKLSCGSEFMLIDYPFSYFGKTPLVQLKPYNINYFRKKKIQRLLNKP